MTVLIDPSQIPYLWLSLISNQTDWCLSLQVPPPANIQRFTGSSTGLRGHYYDQPQQPQPRVSNTSFLLLSEKKYAVVDRNIDCRSLCGCWPISVWLIIQKLKLYSNVTRVHLVYFRNKHIYIIEKSLMMSSVDGLSSQSDTDLL